jgi:hypothetical protein
MFHAICVVNTPILEGPNIPEESPLFQPLKQIIILIKCLYLCDTFSKFTISLLMLIAYQGRFIANSKLCTTLSATLTIAPNQSSSVSKGKSFNTINYRSCGALKVLLWYMSLN